MSASEYDVTTVDLKTDVPSGWSLTGLSAPKFDGVNYYRAVLSGQSSVTFTLDRDSFVEFEYQVYSPAEDVTTTLRLGSELLRQRTFSAGQFETTERVGAFIPAGTHTLTLDYTCKAESCADAVNQYWTKVRLVPPNPVAARQVSGLHIEKQFLNAPDTPLQIVGAGPLQFDGVNFMRHLPGQDIKLLWTSGKALNVSLYVYSPQDFRVTARIQGKIVDVQQGNKTKGVPLAISLSPYPDARSMTIEIKCLNNGAERGCAYLYFPQVTVDTAPPVTPVMVIGATLAVTGVLTALGKLLAPAKSC